MKKRCPICKKEIDCPEDTDLKNHKEWCKRENAKD